MKRLLKLAVPLALWLPTLASASTVWKGDFETGNLSQWDRQQSVSSDRLLVVSDPVREGRYALKATVRQGDDPINASGNRNELLYLGREETGSEFVYSWSTLFPNSFPKSSKWQIFAQWHHEGCCGSPPLEMYVVNDEMRLRVGGSSGTIVWRAPLQRDKWNDFVLRVKWSPNAQEGFVEMHHDGKLVLPAYKAATQYPGERNYLKLGLYRDESIPQEGVIFHDGFTMATSLAEVMQPQAPVVAEPAPAPAPAPVAEAAPLEEPSPDEAAPIAELPTDPGAPPAPGPGGFVPEDPMLAGTLPVGSCGASSTGGTPLLLGGALALLALLARRKQAPAYARSRRRPQPRR